MEKLSCISLDPDHDAKINHKGYSEHRQSYDKSFVNVLFFHLDVFPNYVVRLRCPLGLYLMPKELTFLVSKAQQLVVTILCIHDDEGANDFLQRLFPVFLLFNQCVDLFIYSLHFLIIFLGQIFASFDQLLNDILIIKLHSHVSDQVRLFPIFVG